MITTIPEKRRVKSVARKGRDGEGGVKSTLGIRPGCVSPYTSKRLGHEEDYGKDGDHGTDNARSGPRSRHSPSASLTQLARAYVQRGENVPFNESHISRLSFVMSRKKFSSQFWHGAVRTSSYLHITGFL